MPGDQKTGRDIPPATKSQQKLLEEMGPIDTEVMLSENRQPMTRMRFGILEYEDPDPWLRKLPGSLPTSLAQRSSCTSEERGRGLHPRVCCLGTNKLTEQCFAYTMRCYGVVWADIWGGVRNSCQLWKTSRDPAPLFPMFPPPPTAWCTRTPLDKLPQGRQPFSHTDRKMRKLMGVIWAHFNNNELMHMPGFDLFWCVDSWQELWSYVGNWKNWK